MTGDRISDDLEGALELLRRDGCKPALGLLCDFRLPQQGRTTCPTASAAAWIADLVRVKAACLVHKRISALRQSPRLADSPRIRRPAKLAPARASNANG